LATLSGKTYEVQIHNGDGRWIVTDVHETRSSSLKQAEELFESNKFGGVRVLAESDRSGQEIIFEEAIEGFDEKPITVVSIDDAPLCSTFADYFELSSRRAIAKVLRNYLDRRGCSALELMFDGSEIKMLENNDALFPKAIQQIASAQNRGKNSKPSKRIDELFEIVPRIRKKAVEVVNDDAGYRVLKSKGIDALIKHVNANHSVDDRSYFMRHAFAQYLGDGGDWNTKIDILTKLGVDELSMDGQTFLDETLAEVLDGASAIRELLAGQPDAATANQVLVKLCQGRAEKHASSLSCISEVNDLFHRCETPLSKAVILERVAGYLGGVNRLTKEGPEQERKAFLLITRELTDMSGMMGGAGMCGAVTRRARIVFSKDGDNLSFPEAMARVIDLLPHRAARLGYLVELSLSPVASDYKPLVLATLGKTVKQLSSLASLVPTGSPQSVIQEAVEGLQKRLSSDDVPAEWRTALSSTFQSLLNKPDKDKASSETVIITDEEFNAMIKKKPVEKNATSGDLLFEEGDLGDEAYLIQSGEVEVFHKVGNEEFVIATLGKGEIFGEMSLIDNQPRMASARVMADTRLTVISRSAVQMRLQKLEQEDRVMRRLLDVLVNRLRGDAQIGA
jgi:CRP/FNR family cyclic AMP-dependent transcriptional regulator